MRPEPNAALSEILARDREAGVDIFDDGHREPPPPGPPEVLPPLVPVAIPPPDWRAENAAAERRDAADASRYRDAVEPEPGPPPPESLRSRPAKRRRKAPPPVTAGGHGATPNLDAVKSWKQEDHR